MALIDISTETWATRQDRLGNAVVGEAFTITNVLGATVLSGTTDANGQMAGTLDPGAYTVAGPGYSKAVHVVAGAKDPKQNYNVKDYGAKGDNATNDGTALAAAITACSSAGGGVVVLPPGTYIITAEIVVPSNVELRGSGRDVTAIKRTGATAGKVLVNSDMTSGNVGITVRDLTVDRTDGADALSTTADNAINFRYVDRLLIENVRARGGMKAIHLQSCSGWLVRPRCDTFRDNGIAINDATGVGMPSAADQEMFVIEPIVRQTAATKAAAGSSPMIITQARTKVIDPDVISTVALSGFGIEIANPTTNPDDIVVRGGHLVGCGILVGHGDRHAIRDVSLEDGAVAGSARVMLVPTGGSAAIADCKVRGVTINGALGVPNGNLRIEGATGTDVSDCSLHGGATLFVSVASKPTTAIRNVAGYTDAAPSIASAATLVVDPGIEVALVTGTTNITSISASVRHTGRRVTLIFAGALTVTDGSNLKLSGNFVTTADDTITLVCDGTNWLESSRSVN